MKEVFIIGGGPSLKNFDFKQFKKKETIAINKAVFDLQSPTYFVTMDYMFIFKIKRCFDRFKRKKTTKIFVANLAEPYLRERYGRIIDTRYNHIYDLSPFQVIIKSYAPNGLGLEFQDFRHGECSGYCALQFAIIMGYNPIYLLGIDLTCDGQTHYHEGYGENHKSFKAKLQNYYNYFKSGLTDIKKKRPDLRIYNCSKTSRLNELIPYKGVK